MGEWCEFKSTVKIGDEYREVLCGAEYERIPADGLGFVAYKMVYNTFRILDERKINVVQFPMSAESKKGAVA